LIILVIVYLNSSFEISSSSLLFNSFIVEMLDFERELLPCCYIVSILVIIHLGLFLVGDSNPMCPFSWGFLKDYLGLDSSWVVVYCLVTRLGVCNSEVKHSASLLEMLVATSYSAQIQKALLLKLSLLINHSLELAAIPKEDQLLLLLQYIEVLVAKMNLRGLRRPKE
jgi:hypothetical protein